MKKQRGRCAFAREDRWGPKWVVCTWASKTTEVNSKERGSVRITQCQRCIMWEEAQKEGAK